MENPLEQKICNSKKRADYQFSKNELPQGSTHRQASVCCHFRFCVVPRNSLLNRKGISCRGILAALISRFLQISLKLFALKKRGTLSTCWRTNSSLSCLLMIAFLFFLQKKVMHSCQNCFF